MLLAGAGQVFSECYLEITLFQSSDFFSEAYCPITCLVGLWLPGAVIGNAVTVALKRHFERNTKRGNQNGTGVRAGNRKRTKIVTWDRV